jgi:hypothetical protein
MGDQVHPRRTGLVQNLVDQPQQILGGLFDRERLRPGEVGPADVGTGPGAIGRSILARTALPSGGGVVVEAVYPDRIPIDLPRALRVQVGLLTAFDEQFVSHLGNKPQQRAFELVEDRITLAVHTNVGRAVVEAVERVVDRRVDPACGTGKPAHVDDRKPSAHAAPPT